jgi:hypothetical protein
VIAESPRTARSIATFERRFGKAHLDFACHAAVPIALTPELAYEIWATFRVDMAQAPLGVPWIAVADLLLSELCSEVGPELYEIRPDVRKALVARLRRDGRFGEERLREVADFLLAAAESGLRTRDPFAGSLSVSQRWAALAYTAPERAAAMIAEAMAELSAADPSAWARLEAVLSDLEEPLSEHEELRSLATAMAALGRGRSDGLERHLREHGRTISVAGREVSIPAEALAAIAPAAAESAPSPREPAPEEEAANKRASPRPLQVFLVGTGSADLSFEVRVAAESLGRELARAGHVLLTGGWFGVDEIAARAFAEALGDDALLKERLLQFGSGAMSVVFDKGTRIVADEVEDEIGYHAAAVRRCDVVVCVGGRQGSIEVLEWADRLGKHIVPLRWTGGAAREFVPSTRGHVPICHARRVRRMLDFPASSSVRAERLIARAMGVIELADPDRAQAFGRYSDKLADLLLVLDPAVHTSDVKELREYLDELREAGTGEDPGSRLTDLSVGRLEAAAAAFPEWLIDDAHRVAGLSGWDKSGEAHRMLALIAGRYARAQIAEELKEIFWGARAPGMTEETHQLTVAVWSSLTGTNSDKSERDMPYLEWLRPVVVAWARNILEGNREGVDPLIPGALQVIAPRPEKGFLARLLASEDRFERVSGYLWARAFAVAPDGVQPFEAALDLERKDVDPARDGWARRALRWLAYALIAVLDGPELTRGEAGSEAAGRVREVLERLHRFWSDHPELDPAKTGRELVERRLQQGAPPSP